MNQDRRAELKRLKAEQFQKAAAKFKEAVQAGTVKVIR